LATFTKLETSDVRALLESYNLPELQGVSGIPAGSVNSNFEVALGGARLFLRVYEEQAFDGADAETRLIAALAARGVKTPPPVARKDGGLVSEVRGKPAALFPWQLGGMRCQESVSPEDAERVGEALARIHVAGEGLPRGEGRFRPAELEVRLERIAAATDPSLAANDAPLRASLARWNAARRALPRGLVHGDLFRDNVLWQGGGLSESPDTASRTSPRIAALLDFESAHRGPFAYDMAVTILSWSFRDTFDHASGRAIVAGYREVRELEPAERDALHAEAIFAALRFTITRITDDAIRVGKKWQRFVARREALEQLGPAGLQEALGL